MLNLVYKLPTGVIRVKSYPTNLGQKDIYRREILDKKSRNYPPNLNMSFSGDSIQNKFMEDRTTILFQILTKIGGGSQL